MNHSFDYDLIVIGTGAAGAGVAFRCARAGWNVAIVDNRPYGGTCALRGCDPKKVLVGIAECYDLVQRLNGYGIEGTQIKINWTDLMQFKRTFTDPVPESRMKAFQNAGIRTFKGTARFVDPHTLEIDGQSITAEKIHIATGARPRKLNIPGEEFIITSDDFLELNDIPPRIVFIGGGYISFEFSHVSRRAGSEVTILHRSQQPLKRFEPALVEPLVRATRELGIHVELNAPVRKVERIDGHFRVHFGSEGDNTLDCDLVVHGAGRVPNTDDLMLENADVSYTSKGIQVNAYLQTSQPHIYAAGDVADTGAPALTPVAGKEAVIAAKNLLEGPSYKIDYRAIPSVVFTIPSLASVGLTEVEAKNKGIPYQVSEGDASPWYVARRIRETPVAYKILTSPTQGHILGAHILGMHAEELINIFALAIQQELTVGDLKTLLYAYPTAASNIPYMLP